MKKFKQRGTGRTTKMQRAQLDELKTKVLNDFKDLGAWLYHQARGGSVYIKFRDERLRSLRISDHGNIPRYRYKWNLELNGTTRVTNDNGVTRYHFNHEDIDALHKIMKQYLSTIERNDRMRDVKRSTLDMFL